MGNYLWTYARRLLHALAEAGGHLPPAHELQPLIGPTGAVMWTETTRAPGRQPSPGDVLTTEALPEPIEMAPEVDTRRPEPVGAVAGASE
jgi:hypothetical protein